eukprot:m.318783 g.318783  ORF g.318783 m.318783 type:complete len:664 (-) comp20290_c2_seq1:282-2273(-)
MSTCTDAARVLDSMDDTSLAIEESTGGYKSLAERALLAGACVACALRFNGCWNPASFQSPWQTLVRSYPSITQYNRDREADGRDTSPCTVCLGILQQAVSHPKDNAEHVAACVKKENRKFSHFGVAVQIPMECVIRDRCMWEHLRATKPSTKVIPADSTADTPSANCISKTEVPAENDAISCHQSVPGIRDALRYILLPYLEEALRVSSKPGVGVELLLSYSHSETVNDWDVLKSIEPSVFRERRQKSRKPWFRQTNVDSNAKAENESNQPTLPQVEKCLEAAANRETCKHRGIAQYISCPPTPVKTFSALPHVVGTHEPVYIAGRYTKHSRAVSQSPWFMDDADEEGDGPGGRGSRDPQTNGTKGVCFAFQRGQCTRGEKCKFAHATPTSGAETTEDTQKGKAKSEAISETPTERTTRPARDERKCKTTHSVEELIMPRVKELFGVDKAKFSSSGREDVDVRMLGNGRPFVLELLDPKNPAPGLYDTATAPKEYVVDLHDLQHRINAAPENIPSPLVQVSHLQVVSKKATQVLRDGATTKTKTYCCVIWTATPPTDEQLATLDTHRDLVLHQTTPVRVSHRRTLMVRERKVHWMRHRRLSQPNYFKLWLSTEAGTYIKEFVHGDLGRTFPNLGTLLGCEVDILSLDVVEVGLDWPPPLPGRT